MTNKADILHIGISDRGQLFYDWKFQYESLGGSGLVYDENGVLQSVAGYTPKELHSIATAAGRGIGEYTPCRPDCSTNSSRLA